MHLTLHLTNQCNLNCKYCFVAQGPERMTRDTAFAAVRLSMKTQSRSGLLFYGGEPLLERQLIYDIVDYTKVLKKETGHVFFYKMTTNGILLDEDFLKFADTINLTIGFSHDGLAQDDCRLFHNGGGSFSVLEEKIPLLLKYQPYAVGMSVVDPSTVHRTAETVKFLFDNGFKYITIGMNYCRNAPWTEEKLKTLEGEYKKIAHMYINWTREVKKFYISSFDMKILSHLKGDKYHSDRREMAMNQPSVAPDGKIYSVSRHLGDSAFEIGDVFSGINKAKQQNIASQGKNILKACKKCAIKSRCNYAYDNLRYENSNYISDVSPVQCAHERLVTPIADYVAETLFKEKNPLFIHRHYNELYPIMSLVEDMG